MKVLLFIDSLGSGGAQRQLVTLASLFKKRGLEVEVLCYVSVDFFSKILMDNGIKINEVLANNPIERIFKIRSFIRKNKYDVVISFLDTPDFLNCISALGGHSWKVITSERSARKNKFDSKRGKIIGWIKRYSDAIVCNSENAKNIWLKHYPEYSEKLKVIYNTVELTDSISTSYTPLNGGVIKIVVAASYQGLKNSVGLVKALSLLNKEEREKLSIDWYGRRNVDSINGSNIYEKTLELIKKSKLEGVINLYDHSKDIYSKMYESDFIALFSTVEGLPNVICEGMVLGKPIIMTKVSDYNNFIDDFNGLLCEDKTPEAIATTLRKLLKFSMSDIVEMGEVSRKKAKELFNSENVIGQWLELIN